MIPAAISSWDLSGRREHLQARRRRHRPGLAQAETRVAQEQAAAIAKALHEDEAHLPRRPGRRGDPLTHLSGSMPFQAGTLTRRWPRVPLMITFRSEMSFAVVVSCRTCPGLAITSM